MKDDIRETLDELLAAIPLQRRVVLRRVPMQDCGSCSLSDSEKTITICLPISGNRQTLLDSLLHEYAHAMVFDKLGWHPPLWGQCHAKAYTSWVEKNI